MNPLQKYSTLMSYYYILLFHKVQCITTPLISQNSLNHPSKLQTIVLEDG